MYGDRSPTSGTLASDSAPLAAERRRWTCGSYKAESVSQPAAESVPSLIIGAASALFASALNVVIPDVATTVDIRSYSANPQASRVCIQRRCSRCASCGHVIVCRCFSVWEGRRPTADWLRTSVRTRWWWLPVTAETATKSLTTQWRQTLTSLSLATTTTTTASRVFRPPNNRFVSYGRT